MYPVTGINKSNPIYNTIATGVTIIATGNPEPSNGFNNVRNPTKKASEKILINCSFAIAKVNATAPVIESIIRKLLLFVLIILLIVSHSEFVTTNV